MHYSRIDLDRFDLAPHAKPIEQALISDGEPHRGLTKRRPNDARAMVPSRLHEIEMTGVEPMGGKQ